MNRRTLLQALMAIPMGLMGARSATPKQTLSIDTSKPSTHEGEFKVEYYDQISFSEIGLDGCSQTVYLKPRTTVVLSKEWRMSQIKNQTRDA